VLVLEASSVIFLVLVFVILSLLKDCVWNVVLVHFFH
jgi:hypothetical protein